jgi:hypothetical protein
VPGPPPWQGFFVDQVQALFVALAILGAMSLIALFGWLMLFGGCLSRKQTGSCLRAVEATGPTLPARMVTGSGHGAAAPRKTSGQRDASIICAFRSASRDRPISRLFELTISFRLTASRRKGYMAHLSLLLESE